MKAEYNSEQVRKIDLYRRRIQTYQFPTVEIVDASLAVATEIFTRLNVGGKSLSVFEIMVAKTWDDARGFDLNDKVEGLNKELAKSGYGGIDPTILMQNNAALVLKSIKSVDILAMDKMDFINNWDKSCTAIKQSVDFCRSNLKIPVRALLPYQRTLIPLSYFFFKAQNDPVGNTKKKLIDLFFRIGLSERYSGSTETKLSQDLRNIDLILEGKDCLYDFGVDISAEFIQRNGSFRAGKAYIKTLLCVLAAQKPKDFSTGGEVILDNALLRQKNSRNYHHFFPTSQFGKGIISDLESNHIGNITLVGGHLNKNKIRAKTPSQYLAEFAKDNYNLTSDLKSHLIDLDAMKIDQDDYDTFLPLRCLALSQALQERLVPYPMDAMAPKILGDVSADEEKEGEEPGEADDSLEGESA